MQKLFQDRRTVLFIAILALFSLVLLAGSLKDMDFQPGKAVGGSDTISAERAVNIGELIQQAAEVPFWEQMAFWGILFLIVLLLASILDPQLRKKLILAFLRLAIFAIVFLYLLENNPDIFSGFLTQLTFAAGLEPIQQTASAPMPVFQAPQMSYWFSYSVALGLMLMFVLFAWWLNRVWTRIKELSSARQPLGEIARIAQRSLGELKSGRNFENAILECYARMSSVVDERKGLRRDHAMTPAEFSMRLARAGLPREPVEKLTRLFEAARYGGQRAGESEINEAVSSLTSILRYCGDEA